MLLQTVLDVGDCNVVAPEVLRLAYGTLEATRAGVAFEDVSSQLQQAQRLAAEDKLVALELRPRAHDRAV
ncbi:hypothetical protein A0H81_01836 [Grifola frondosa]|uniref:Uncharacterized protein n=1 Tax=Grifola frondosa TaxID=5627 RepID=A0A1C7MK31_GRIFR|nr:hypothetical protein A0H81_01836 [Grifola frondosa]